MVELSQVIILFIPVTLFFFYAMAFDAKVRTFEEEEEQRKKDSKEIDDVDNRAETGSRKRSSYYVYILIVVKIITKTCAKCHLASCQNINLKLRLRLLYSIRHGI